MATKEPWKGRPAAIGRVLMRIVKCFILQIQGPKTGIHRNISI
jgi:hypothetical protein